MRSVELNGYGQARQLTLFEHGAPVLQVLTCDTTATGASICCAGCGPAGGSRTCSSTRPNTTASTPWPTTGWTSARTPARSPTRPAPRPATPSHAAQADLIAAERALPQLLAGPGTPKQKNAALPGLHRRIHAATAALAARQDRAARRPRQNRRDRPGPGRETGPTPARTPRPADGPAAARLQRRGLAGPTVQRLPRPTTTNTGPSCATCCTWADTSTTPAPPSPSPWTGPTAHAWPAPCTTSPRNSPPARHPCPATADP